MKKATHIAISLLGLGLLILSCAGTTTDTSNLSSLLDIKPLVGSWKRTAGGYLLTIKDIDGKVVINYISPSQGSINVSESRISTEGNGTKIQVTLRDKNYPGSHYTLIYDEKGDILRGTYTYPSGILEVAFLRATPIVN